MRHMFDDANAFNKMPEGWDTSKVTDSFRIFYSAAAWKARFTGGTDSTLPGGSWTRIDNACDASYPPVNGAVGTCTDTLVSGTSCVPECDAGYTFWRGVTSCTDRALTEVAVCVPDVTTRAELKAAVDACVGDRLCEMTMPHWDVSQVTDMSFLFQGMSQFNVDISQWEMSQVTTAAGMFEGAASFSQAINGWILTSGANTTGMFTGADTWLSRASRTDGSDTTDGPPSAWSVSGLCLENERVLSSWCVACGAGKYNGPGDDPALGVDTECDRFGTRDALKAAVDNCLAVDPTGVACCNHGADCGAAGTVEMPDWDVSLVTRHEQLFYNKGSFNADISRWDTSSVTTMYRMFRGAQRVQPRYRYMGHLERHDHERDVLVCLRVQPASIEVGRQLGHGPCTKCSTTLTHSTPCRRAGTHPKSRPLYIYFLLQTHGMPGSTGGNDHTLPDRGWTRKDNACDASLPPLNGDVGNCTDTLVSGTSCVPACDPYYVLEGVTSCTDRVLTQQATCVPWRFTDGAELKATVDACLDAVPSGRVVLLLGQAVLAPRPGDEAMRRRWMRGHA